MFGGNAVLTEIRDIGFRALFDHFLQETGDLVQPEPGLIAPYNVSELLRVHCRYRRRVFWHILTQWVFSHELP